MRGSVTFEWLGRRRDREGKRRGEGPAVGVPRGVEKAWGLAPTVSRPVVTRARRTWTARRCRCSDRGAPDADGRAPMAVRAGGSGEARAVREHEWAGPRRKRGGRAQMNSMTLNLFKLI
jgi:hypothetical protein